jgi:quercetin dioxygenase-like cupin family protein
LRERRIDPTADGRLRVRSSRLRDGGQGRGAVLSTVGDTPREHRRRTRVRGTGALREILPYYRWGILAGLVGAFVVAVFFLAIDLAAGRPFSTPTALGATVFLGAPFDLAQAPNWTLIAGYSAVHGGVFIGLALLVSSLVLGSRRPPPPPASLTLILIGFFFAGLTLLYAGFVIFSSTTLATAPSTALVLSANLLSATAMALVSNYAFQTRWRAESPLRPPRGREQGAAAERSYRGTDRLRDRIERGTRLDEEWLHLFSLARFARALRAEREYREQGRNAMILMKTGQLRVVLEVAAEGAKIAEHVVPGPAIVHVLDGELDLVCLDETRVARAGEIVVIPHDRPRAMAAKSEVAFLWMLAMETDADASTG